jgi:hypothetical protein
MDSAWAQGPETSLAYLVVPPYGPQGSIPVLASAQLVRGQWHADDRVRMHEISN